ncbi:regulatory protein (PadR like) [Mycobacterium tuberculosis]|nr:regulatory protein (PadR like) [Mycobacterium tuberculosis]CMH04708.1 regulatory protein (PadR like) [Mycobacterium tuberculosis]
MAGPTRRYTRSPTAAGPSWLAGSPSRSARPGPAAAALTDSSTRDIAVKLRGAGYGDVAALYTQVTALRAERVKSLDTYRGIEKRTFADPSALDGAALHQYLVLRGGIRAEESAIDWLDEVAEALQEKR